MQSFDNKVVLITGGGAGIGLAAAVAFAREGARVIITGRREDALSAAARSAPGIDYVVADAGNAADAARTIDEAVALAGGSTCWSTMRAPVQSCRWSRLPSKRSARSSPSIRSDRRCSRLPRCRI
ncbi:SDR family NAD(P)-dependent oxidoreductase [Burkholderia cenocepacia]|uniref:SDR family NAD(P)-dependent oxidoreductase n=1 Tax=Burkholderia cenocepacia TaxID=95486 RepID=UPI003AF31602